MMGNHGAYSHPNCQLVMCWAHTVLYPRLYRTQRIFLKIPNCFHVFFVLAAVLFIYQRFHRCSLSFCKNSIENTFALQIVLNVGSIAFFCAFECGVGCGTARGLYLCTEFAAGICKLSHGIGWGRRIACCMHKITSIITHIAELANTKVVKFSFLSACCNLFGAFMYHKVSRLYQNAVQIYSGFVQR